MYKTFNEVLDSRTVAINNIVGSELASGIKTLNYGIGTEDWKDKYQKLIMTYNKTGSIYFKNVLDDSLKNEEAFKEEYVKKINKETEKYDLTLNTGNAIVNMLKGSNIHYESMYPLKNLSIYGGSLLLADPDSKGHSFIITYDANRVKWLTESSGIKIKHKANFTVKSSGLSVDVNVIITDSTIKKLSKQEVGVVEDLIYALDNKTEEPRGDVKKLLGEILKFRDGCDECVLDVDADEFWSIDGNVTPLRVTRVGSATVGAEAFDFLDKAFYKVDKAFENSIKGVMGFFQSTNIFIEDLIDYRTKTPSITNLYKQKVNFIKNTSKVKFYNVSEVKAPVILGLNISYKGLLNILESNVSYVKGMEDTMVKFESFLDSVIESNKDSFTLSKDTSEVSAITKNATLINKSMDKVTNNKVLSDRVKLGKLTKDFSELRDVVNDSLKTGTHYKMENLEKLYDINESINIKLDLLYTAIKSKSINMSKDDILYISEYIGSVAKMLTAVAFLFYLYYQLIDMLVAAVKIVDMDNENGSTLVSIASTLSDGWTLLRNAFK